MSATKIVALMPSETEASSFYRGLGPLYRLSRAYPAEFEITKKRELSWVDYVEPHIAFFLRPHDPLHVDMIRRFKSFGAKVVIDWDDDIFTVKESHSSHAIASSDSVRNAVAAGVKLADEVWVTTPRLAHVLGQFTTVDKVCVIPNAIDDVMCPTPTWPNKTSAPVIAWRGSSTHVDDILAYRDFFNATEAAGYRFIFFGHKPAREMEQIGIKRGSWSWIPTMDVDFYFASLRRLNCPFHFVPLEETLFNEAKSNIAYLESAWIGGSVPLVTKMWDGLPGSITITEDMFNSPCDMSHFLDAAYDARLPKVCDAQKLIREKYTLSNVNEQRRQRLTALRFAE